MAIIEDKALCDAEAVKTVTHRTHKIDLTLTEIGDGTLIIDGMDMSDAIGASIRLDNDPDTGPVLTVQILGDFEAHAEGRVKIDDEAAKALEALGWTPPTAAARGGRR